MLLAALATSCTWLPSEFNVSPLFRQRLDAAGTLLELDVLWPLIHYEQTPDGGDDFRIRPFYRRVTEPDQRDFVANPAVEHQFLWPLGKVRSDQEQTLSRLFPLWWHRARSDDLGLRETDWYALFPFLWGGSRDDGEENYFGFFPFFADLPDFFAYDRLTFVLWPLYTRTEWRGRIGHVLLWPFIGWGSGEVGYRWHRFLPLWAWVDEPKRSYRSILWPFVHWGTERSATTDPAAALVDPTSDVEPLAEPIHRWWLWPLIGRQYSDEVAAWSFLWPLFQYVSQGDRRVKIDAPWPFFRYEIDRSEFTPLRQWWLWPLIAHTITDRQEAWVWLWPLIWKRRYWDPEDEETHHQVVPFFTKIRRDGEDGSHAELVQVWPLMHSTIEVDPGQGREGEWNLLSPWPWFGGTAEGFDEAYGWLWTLAKGRRRAPDDASIEFTANLYTERRRGDVTQSSVPFLFNYEGDRSGGTLRLFQFLPIPWSGTAPEADEEGRR